MSYGDGGFYFLQPVGNGYGGIEVRSNRGGYGAARPALATERLGPSALNSILDRYKAYLRQLYQKFLGYPLLTASRVAAEKKFNEAKRAEPVLKSMIKSAAGSSGKGAHWRYGDLPSTVQSGIGVWIVKNIIDPRYGGVPGAVTYDAGSTVTYDTYGPSSTRDTTKVPSIPKIPGPKLGGGGGTTQTLTTAPPATVMGPQAVATDTEQAVAASQAAMSAQAADTVTAAQVEQARVDGGFLSSNTGKAVAAVAAAGVGYFVWKQIKKNRGG